MIEQVDQKLRERVNKAIGNIRLIASRSKRANVLDATQRAEIVVNLLADFRRYVNYRLESLSSLYEFDVFKHDTPTLLRVTAAQDEAGIIFHNLSHAKQVSYRDEYKQVWLLLGDLRDYLAQLIARSV